MAFANSWRRVGHFLFLVLTALGWIVPWTVPHAFEKESMEFKNSLRQPVIAFQWVTQDQPFSD
ncbi:MAG: hypothetical protein ACO3A2_05860 [Bdellovibrionia bacterium]